MLVGMVPKRTPPHAVMKDPATAPRLSASAKVRALPRSVPSPCMSLGSQVPRPYQASRVTTVVSANRMLMVRNRGPSRAPKPWPGLWPGVCDRAVGQRLARDRHQHSQGTSANRNIGCQPQFGMTGMPSSAATDPPIGTPDIIMVATAARHFGAMSSAARALAVGTRPPRPRPASRRRAPNITGPVARAHKRGEYRQDHGAADHRTLAAYRIRQPSGEDGSDHHAQERQAAQGSCGGRTDTPVLLQAGDDVAVHDEVVSVEDDEQPAHDDGRQRGAVQSGPAGRWLWLRSR